MVQHWRMHKAIVRATVSLGLFTHTSTHYTHTHTHTPIPPHGSPEQIKAWSRAYMISSIATPTCAAAQGVPKGWNSSLHCIWVQFSKFHLSTYRQRPQFSSQKYDGVSNVNMRDDVPFGLSKFLNFLCCKTPIYDGVISSSIIFSEEISVCHGRIIGSHAVIFTCHIG